MSVFKVFDVAGSGMSAQMLRLNTVASNLANAEGYVYSPDIDAVTEMANMISASRSYQNNVEVLSTAKELMLRTLQLGQG
jgi:flagellar basal body rod protein FlgC